jgi:hypothetical protein
MTIADQTVSADPGGNHVIVQLNAWHDRGRIDASGVRFSSFAERQLAGRSFGRMGRHQSDVCFRHAHTEAGADPTRTPDRRHSAAAKSVPRELIRIAYRGPEQICERMTLFAWAGWLSPRASGISKPELLIPEPTCARSPTDRARCASHAMRERHDLPAVRLQLYNLSSTGRRPCFCSTRKGGHARALLVVQLGTEDSSRHRASSVHESGNAGVNADGTRCANRQARLTPHRGRRRRTRVPANNGAPS